MLHHVQVLLFYWYRRQHRRRGIKKTYWMHEIYRRRNQFGEYHRLVQELQLDHGLFHKYFRMSKEQFRIVLSFVEEGIAKLNTHLRESIGARERLALTIRYVKHKMCFSNIYLKNDKPEYLNNHQNYRKTTDLFYNYSILIGKQRT